MSTKQLYVTVFILSFAFINLTAQNDDQDVVLSPEDITVLLQIKKSVEDEKRQEHNRDIRNILRASIRVDLVSRNIEKLEARLIDNQQHKSIAEYLNPSSDKLTGKSYNEYIYEQAKIIFVDKENFREEDKNRFTEVLKNLTSKNSNEEPSLVKGIITTVLNSNPVTNLIGKVVGSAASWFRSTKTGRKITEVKVAFNTEKLKEFQDSLGTYVRFYDKALELNQKFGEGLDDFTSDIALLQENMVSLQDSLNTLLKIARLPNGSNLNENELMQRFPFSLKKSIEGNREKSFQELANIANKIADIEEKEAQYSAELNDKIGVYFAGISLLIEEFTGKLANTEISFTEIDINSKIFALTNGVKVAEKDLNFNQLELLEKWQTPENESFLLEANLRESLINLQIDYSNIKILEEF